jgi:hypothetical protein
VLTSDDEGGYAAESSPRDISISGLVARLVSHRQYVNIDIMAMHVPRKDYLP